MLLKIQNPESPTGIARISEGASRFYAYENELKVRTEQTKTKARANLWSELPSLFLEFLRIIDGVEKQLDKLLLILQNIQSRQFAHDRVR